jgi:4-amino-4-deoxy-L-arabinose transferase-like glycosyltransferase
MTSAMGRYRPMLTAVLLGLVALLVGGRDLDRAPVYLYHDEAIYALNAHSILTTGRDLMGLRLPLFLHTFAWIPPIAIYARVLTFVFLPVSEFTTRFPGVVFFAIDVSLTYLVGRRLFKREGLAILAGVFLMLTPAHVIHARMATDHICHMPFFIAFVLLIIDYIERRRLISLGAATACLGLGIYGYNGAMTQTPVFLALTGALLFFVLKIRTLRPYVVAAAGMALAMLPFALWLLVHPETLTDQLRSYDVSSSGQAAARSVGHSLYSALTVRLDAYYNYFDPSLLFFNGDQSLLDSTREVGVFLLPIVVFLPAGAYYILSQRRTIPDLFVLTGFLAAPIGALIVGEVKASRALVMAPLAALVCARGVEALMSARSLTWRAAAIVLLAALGLQFQSFYADYVGPYRERSSQAFEGNRDAAIASLVARADATRAPALYVSNDILLVNYSWQFYALKYRRPDLKTRMLSFDGQFDFATAPAGSLFLSRPDSDRAGALDASGLTRVATIDNIDGHPAFAVYEK